MTLLRRPTRNRNIHYSTKRTEAIIWLTWLVLGEKPRPANKESSQKSLHISLGTLYLLVHIENNHRKGLSWCPIDWMG